MVANIEISMGKALALRIACSLALLEHGGRSSNRLDRQAGADAKHSTPAGESGRCSTDEGGALRK